MTPYWISDRNDFRYFLSTSHPDASCQVCSQLDFWFRRRSAKYIFKMAAMAAILVSDQNDFSYFDLLVTPILHIKFQDNRSCVSGEEVKNIFSRWRPSWSFIGTILAIFIYKSPRCFVPSFKSVGLSVQKKLKIDFQDGHHGRHLGFLIGTILAIFDEQIILMLPTKFPLNRRFG